MHIKNNLVVMFLWLGFGRAMAVSAALIFPGQNAPRVSLAGIKPWQPVHNMGTQQILDLVHDNAVSFDSCRMATICRAEVVAQDQKERYHRLRSLFARYVEAAHLFEDDSLVRVIQENYEPLASEAEDSDFMVSDCAVNQVYALDGHMVINQAVHGVLSRHSFETVEGVSAAVKELEQKIQDDFKRHGVATHAELLRDLQKLNSKPLSASYHCMQEVGKILSQFPSESSQAIRDQFPWYLRRMV